MVQKRWIIKVRLKHVVVAPLVVFLVVQLTVFWIWHKPETSANGVVSKVSKGLQPKDDQKLKINTNLNGHCVKKVETNPKLHQILDQVNDEPGWKWISDRISQNWKDWQNLWTRLRQNNGSTFNINGVQKRVLVVPGVLKATEFASNTSILSGGPLGDLYQWSDVILGLHILGHNVTLAKNFYHVARGLRYNKYWQSPGVGCGMDDIDLIFSDIITMKELPSDVINKYRVLDAYGTEAVYNDVSYALKHDFISRYGQLGLKLKQFYTFYPHSPDNSFMGFTVGKVKVQLNMSKPNIGILYGKDHTYFRGKEEYIKLLMNYMEVHSTVRNHTGLPNGIIHHGVLTSIEYISLLSNAKYLIGVGLPLESTGVMQALSYGCIILNPKFTHQRRFILQMEGKPTTRELSSQIPYLEDYIGPPNVYTVDIQNKTDAEITLKQIRNLQDRRKVQPLTPYAFTIEGFLSRINKYITHQNFCLGLQENNKDTEHVWSPSYDWKSVYANEAFKSCVEICMEFGLICEPNFFRFINTEDIFIRKNISCEKYITDNSVYHPSYHWISRKCLIQAKPHLFSCAGKHTELKRICPCRKQVADMA